MSAKYFCDKCGAEVEEHQHYFVSFKNDANWEHCMKYYISEDIYLCEEHREAVIVLIKAFLEDVIRQEAFVTFTKEVKIIGE
jgi:hypothetical protein